MDSSTFKTNERRIGTMDIHKYIELHTKIEKDQGTDNVKWTAIPKNENLKLPHKKNLPYHLEIEAGLHDPSNMWNFEKEEQNDKDTGNNCDFQFAEIRSNVREIGLGWNAISGFERRYEKSQQRFIVDKSSSESDLSYFTASSLTNDSYTTALEDYEQYWKQPSVDIKSDISIISSVDKNRYKKNALITGLLQSAESDLSDNGMVFHDSSTDQFNTTGFSNGIHNEVKWDSNASEQEMYEDRVFRLFQSKEDADVYVHPLREQIKEDVEWKEYRLLRKGVEYTETPRQYYLSLPDEKFDIFEKVEIKKKPKRKARRNRFRF